jgi:hypothetical protein
LRKHRVCDIKCFLLWIYWSRWKFYRVFISFCNMLSSAYNWKILFGYFVCILLELYSLFCFIIIKAEFLTCLHIFLFFILLYAFLSLLIFCIYIILNLSLTKFFKNWVEIIKFLRFRLLRLINIISHAWNIVMNYRNIFFGL